MREQRIILHSDINHCYAQIEEMKYPQLREVPLAVGGREEARHGIILAKNDLAKAYKIKTGETLREAKTKCPSLCIIHPNYEEYMYYTDKVKAIYRAYSDKVESYGLDEAWIDLSTSCKLFGDGYTIAKTIQKRVYEELGLTISIGMSYNKIFAKLGSDMDKHMGLTVISEDNYKEKVWCLPIEALFYVGRSTKKKLLYYSIDTIGKLANLSIGWMKDHFGKVGELLWLFANGRDVSEVALSFHQDEVKSIGNAITAAKDITSFEEAKIVYYVLVESVASRLREQGLQGKVVSIYLRDKQLRSFTRQRTLKQAVCLTKEIMPHVVELLRRNYDFQIPLRSIGVALSGMEVDHGYRQMNLFMSEEERMQELKLEETIDAIRAKFGFYKIRRCATLKDRTLSDFNPKEDHVIYPESFF